jgi:hypothetical protein
MIQIHFGWSFKVVLFFIFIICILCLALYNQAKGTNVTEMLEGFQKEFEEKVDKDELRNALTSHLNVKNNLEKLGYTFTRADKPKEVIEYKENYLLNNSKMGKSGMGEEFAREIFQSIFKKPFVRVRPDFLYNEETAKNMELDGYCEDLGLAFEYSGIQHYVHPNFTGQSYDEFVKQRIRDAKKRDLCDEHEVYLIVIPYTVKANEMREYIISKLPKKLKSSVNV